MKNTITEALIYEAQGLKDDALIVYKNILKREPTNAAAIAAIRRLSGLSRKKNGRKRADERLFHQDENRRRNNRI